MSIEQSHEMTRQFFDRFGVASLKLPRGWFGRPRDNQHQLTRLDLADGKLVIELDGQQVLTLVGDPSAEVDSNVLRLAGFKTAIWDWREYGSGVPHHEEFAGGTVEFVAPPLHLTT